MLVTEKKGESTGKKGEATREKGGKTGDYDTRVVVVSFSLSLYRDRSVSAKLKIQDTKVVE
jgi:hypothetical protein